MTQRILLTGPEHKITQEKTSLGYYPQCNDVRYILDLHEVKNSHYLQIVPSITFKTKP